MDVLRSQPVVGVDAALLGHAPALLRKKHDGVQLGAKGHIELGIRVERQRVHATLGDLVRLDEHARPR